MVFNLHEIIVNHHLAYRLIGREGPCSIQFAVLDIEGIVDSTKKVARMKNDGRPTNLTESERGLQLNSPSNSATGLSIMKD